MPSRYVLPSLQWGSLKNIVDICPKPQYYCVSHHDLVADFIMPLFNRSAPLCRHRRPCPHPHSRERALQCSVLRTISPRIIQLGMQVEQPSLEKKKSCHC